MIQFHSDLCIGCGKCAWDCTPAAIVMEAGRPSLELPQNCIGCGHCIAICPKNAVYDDMLPMDDVMDAAPGPSPEELLLWLRSRRSCRHFRPDTVSKQDIATLLEAARACPTAKNAQPTRYISVTENIPALLDAALAALSSIGQRQKQAATDPGELRRAENFIRWAQTRAADPTFDPLFFHAPQLLLFVSDKASTNDAAAAAAYCELMAYSLGLGCLYSGYFTACASMSGPIRDLLGLEETEVVVRCLVLGHPAVRFVRTPPRKAPNLTEL